MADLTSAQSSTPVEIVNETSGNTAAVSAAGAVSVNDAQTAGTTTSVNAGSADAGTKRVVLANDQFVPVYFAPATLNNGAETAVAGTAVQVVAANASRKQLVIQNTGLANVRVGTTGVAATTGFRLTPGQAIIINSPNCPTNAIFCIREGAISSTVLAQEMV